MSDKDTQTADTNESYFDKFQKYGKRAAPSITLATLVMTAAVTLTLVHIFKVALLPLAKSPIVQTLLS